MSLSFWQASSPFEALRKRLFSWAAQTAIISALPSPRIRITGRTRAIWFRLRYCICW